jgi:hypothetical protein
VPRADQASSAAADTGWLQEIQQAFFTQRCLHVIARLAIADLLIARPLDVDELARQSNSDADSLFRVLRFLTSRGIFTQPSPRIFGLNPRAESLRSDVPNSARWALMHDLMGRASMEILHSVRTGDCASEKVFGSSLWEYLAGHSEENEWFNKHMQSQAIALAMPAVAAYDWTRSKMVVDVGGGTGVLLSALLKCHSHLSGTLIDQAHVIARAHEVMAAAGVTKRCKSVVGTFFERLGAEGDTYILSRVLHDWDDERAGAILRCIRKSMPSHARLLILEMVVPEDDRPHPSKMIDISMMVLFSGRERTQQEFARLLHSASFDLVAAIPTKGPTLILEAVPA